MVRAMKTAITFRLPEALKQAANAKAAAEGIDLSDVLRDALQAFVDQK